MEKNDSSEDDNLLTADLELSTLSVEEGRFHRVSGSRAIVLYLRVDIHRFCVYYTKLTGMHGNLLCKILASWFF